MKGQREKYGEWESSAEEGDRGGSESLEGQIRRLTKRLDNKTVVRAEWLGEEIGSELNRRMGMGSKERKGTGEERKGKRGVENGRAQVERVRKIGKSRWKEDSRFDGESLKD